MWCWIDTNTGYRGLGKEIFMPKYDAMSVSITSFKSPPSKFIEQTFKNQITVYMIHLEVKYINFCRLYQMQLS